MTDFAAALAEATKASSPSRCSTGLAISKMSDKDRKQLQAALDGDVAGSVIAKALTAMGHRVRAQNVQTHRKGHCSCPSTMS